MRTEEIEIGRTYRDARGYRRQVTGTSSLYKDGLIYIGVLGPGVGKTNHITRASFARWAHSEVRVPSLCESVHAGPRSPFHIRYLDGAGKKLGGGITTDSLCGHVKVKVGGWDLEGEFDARLPNLCAGCLAKYNEEKR